MEVQRQEEEVHLLERFVVTTAMTGMATCRSRRRHCLCCIIVIVILLSAAPPRRSVGGGGGGGCGETWHNGTWTE